MELLSEDLRERFWEVSPWPADVQLGRLEAHVVPTRGRAGRWLIDEVELRVGERVVPSAFVYAPSLLPAEVEALSARLTKALRTSLDGRLRSRGEIRRFVVVEVATPALVEACRREQLGLFDLAGAVQLSTPELVLRIDGHRRVQRASKVSSVSSVGLRVIRTLLNTLEQPLPTRLLARRVRASYSTVWGILESLERAGHVERRHGVGPQVVDARALVRFWCASAPPPVREGYYCGSTTEQALASSFAKLTSRGASGLFTYRSGLFEKEVIVSALPHGFRSAASADILVEAFGLRKITPQNFFILREAADQDHEDGGIRTNPREVSAGPAVSVPQLIFDLHHAGDRAAEQAEALLEDWWRALPPRPIDD